MALVMQCFKIWALESDTPGFDSWIFHLSFITLNMLISLKYDFLVSKIKDEMTYLIGIIVRMKKIVKAPSRVLGNAGSL